MMSAKEIIKFLGLEPLPFEGGYFRQTYRSEEMIEKKALPERYRCSKPFGTAIYYLLTPDMFSALHRLPTDEIFHFYLGDPVTMLQLPPDGTSATITLGSDIRNGHHVQVVVSKNIWQGSILKDGGRFALIGTTMAPGFDFSDYEYGNRDDLIKEYSKHADLIVKLTPTDSD